MLSLFTVIFYVVYLYLYTVLCMKGNFMRISAVNNVGYVTNNNNNVRARKNNNYNNYVSFTAGRPKAGMNGPLARIIKKIVNWIHPQKPQLPRSEEAMKTASKPLGEGEIPQNPQLLKREKALQEARKLLSEGTPPNIVFCNLFLTGESFSRAEIEASMGNVGLSLLDEWLLMGWAKRV